MRKAIILASLCVLAGSVFAEAVITGELKKWHKVTLTFEGPETSETDKLNPFFNYRLNVTFKHTASGKEYIVPGYFAADGDAGNTGAEKGNKWRVHFAPDELGDWNYAVDFRKGPWASISTKKDTGKPGEFMDGATGTFAISKSDKTGRDFRAHGRLNVVGGHYLQFAETQKYFLKAGPDAPENFLSYVEFDGTFKTDGIKDQLVKTWEAHIADWQEGDPTWADGKGKGIIGALNYLASEGLNVVSFLTMNAGGDDANVYPYIDHNIHDRIDVSRMDQWEVVFAHAQQNGLFLHFKLMEHENQGLLDNAAVGANTKLYYREVIARFGHHLALNWNVCEESGEWGHLKTPPQETPERLACAQRIADQDPYDHHRVIHNGKWFDDLYGPKSAYTGASLQTGKPDFRQVHQGVLGIRNASAKAGKPWAVACDEPGDASYALAPDESDPDGVNHTNARINALWGTFFAGGWGVEWYFGYKLPHSDLSCKDYRSRDRFWDYCRIALEFFEQHEIPFWEMENMNALVGNPKNEPKNYCFAKAGELYLVMSRGDVPAELDLSGATGSYTVQWFNPRSGGSLATGTVTSVAGGSKVTLGDAPADSNLDWIVILEKEG